MTKHSMMERSPFRATSPEATFPIGGISANTANPRLSYRSSNTPGKLSVCLLAILVLLCVLTLPGCSKEAEVDGYWDLEEELMSADQFNRFQARRILPHLLIENNKFSIPVPLGKDQKLLCTIQALNSENGVHCIRSYGGEVHGSVYLDGDTLKLTMRGASDVSIWMYTKRQEQKQATVAKPVPHQDAPNSTAERISRIDMAPLSGQWIGNMTSGSDKEQGCDRNYTVFERVEGSSGQVRQLETVDGRAGASTLWRLEGGIDLRPEHDLIAYYLSKNQGSERVRLAVTKSDGQTYATVTVGAEWPSDGAHLSVYANTMPTEALALSGSSGLYARCVTKKVVPRPTGPASEAAPYTAYVRCLIAGQETHVSVCLDQLRVRTNNRTRTYTLAEIVGGDMPMNANGSLKLPLSEHFEVATFNMGKTKYSVLELVITDPAGNEVFQDQAGPYRWIMARN